AHRRHPGAAAREQGNAVGLDGEADDDSEEPRLQRVVLRLLDLLEAARRGGQAEDRHPRARREERDLRHHLAHRGGRPGRLTLGGGPAPLSKPLATRRSTASLPEAVYSSALMPFIRVASDSEIPVGHGLLVENNGRAVAVFNRGGGRFAACGAICPHEDGPLADGWLEGDVVVCPWHGFDFDLDTGQCRVDADLAVVVYPVRVVGGGCGAVLPCPPRPSASTSIRRRGRGWSAGPVSTGRRCGRKAIAAPC